jgi:hypothetical protein
MTSSQCESRKECANHCHCINGFLPQCELRKACANHCDCVSGFLAMQVLERENTSHFVGMSFWWADIGLMVSSTRPVPRVSLCAWRGCCPVKPLLLYYSHNPHAFLCIAFPFFSIIVLHAASNLPIHVQLVFRDNAVYCSVTVSTCILFIWYSNYLEYLLVNLTYLPVQTVRTYAVSRSFWISRYRWHSRIC